MVATTEICQKCGKEPIFVKKRGLGRKCYNAFTAELRRAKVEVSSVEDDGGHMAFEAHLQFAAGFFGTKPFLYRAAIFRLGNKRTHTPAFYDVARDTWIDVIRTRQAYHITKDRYAELRQRFPGLKFELRRPDGSLYGGKGDMSRSSVRRHDFSKDSPELSART